MKIAAAAAAGFVLALLAPVAAQTQGEVSVPTWDDFQALATEVAQLVNRTDDLADRMDALEAENGSDEDATATAGGSDTEDDTGTQSSDEAYTYQSEAAGTVEIPAGYPNPDSVGLAGQGIDATSLPAYEGPTTFDDGQTHVIDGRRITSMLEVRSGHLIVRNSLVDHADGRYGLFSSFDGGGRLTVEDTTMRMRANDQRAIVGPNVTVRRSDVRQGTVVINLKSNSLVEDSFVADPGILPHEGGHHDAIMTNGARGLTLRNNTVLGRWQAQTSAILLQGNSRWDTGLGDVHVEGNFLSGGGYTMYLVAQDGHDPVTGVVRDNLWNAGSWQFGPVRLFNVADGLTWESNRTTAEAPVS